MALVQLDVTGGVRTLTLNAPDRLNALDRPLLDELQRAVETVADDPDVRVVVVQGAGRAFCSGADLDGLFGDRSRPVPELAQHLRSVYASFLGLRDLTVPTIAAVHGPAIGAGLNIALACDVIVAGPDAGFGPTFSRIGLHPGGGCTWLLTQRIGTAATAAALYGGDVIDARAALRLGIAQELVDDPRSRAAELAAQWAEREPDVMAGIKQTVALAATADLDDVVQAESLRQAASLTSETFEAFATRFARQD